MTAGDSLIHRVTHSTRKLLAVYYIGRVRHKEKESKYYILGRNK